MPNGYKQSRIGHTPYPQLGGPKFILSSLSHRKKASTSQKLKYEALEITTVKLGHALKFWLARGIILSLI